MHTVTTRTPTPEELRLIADRSKPDIGSYGCITIIFGVGSAWMLGNLGGWIAGFVSPDASTYGQWIGWSAAASLFIYVLVRFIPDERRLRKRASQDLQAQIIQDIHVTDPRVVEIGLISDNEPILAFEIGENRILFLQGQWLRYDETYGAEPLIGDPYEESLNGLPEPNSFPSTEFTITRFPNSGEVVGIRVSGEYVAPETEVEALEREYEFGDSELLDGSLDDIAGVLAREHQRRTAK